MRLVTILVTLLASATQAFGGSIADAYVRYTQCQERKSFYSGGYAGDDRDVGELYKRGIDRDADLREHRLYLKYRRSKLVAAHKAGQMGHDALRDADSGNDSGESEAGYEDVNDATVEDSDAPPTKSALGGKSAPAESISRTYFSFTNKSEKYPAEVLAEDQQTRWFIAPGATETFDASGVASRSSVQLGARALVKEVTDQKPAIKMSWVYPDVTGGDTVAMHRLKEGGIEVPALEFFIEKPAIEETK
ncbi:MAG: hypothetical protein AAB420_04325 [Patescibacteria group bacterium]